MVENLSLVPDTKSKRHLYLIFLAAVVVVITVGATPLMHLSGDYASEGEVNSTSNSLNRTVLIALYSLVSAAMLVTIRRFFRAHLVDVCVWLLIVLSIGSATWSIVPSDTIVRAIPLIGCMLAAILLATRVDLATQIRIYAFAFVLGCFVSWVFVLFVPEHAVLYAGDWRGYFSEKNELGRHASITVLLLLFLKPERKLYRALIALASGGALILLLAANSVTSVMTLCLGIAVYLYSVIRSSSRRTNTILTFFTVVAIPLVAAIVLIGLPIILGLFGRDPTFTGRTVLWEGSWEAIWNRPLLGYGYGGFWIHGPFSPARDIYFSFGTGGAAHSHNGYIDVLLDFGLLGFVPLILILWSALTYGWRLMISRSSRWAAFPFVIAVTMCIYNFTESTYMKPNSIYWLILLATAMSSIRTLGSYTRSSDMRENE